MGIVGLAPLLEAEDLLEARAQLSMVLWIFHQSDQEFNDVAVEEIKAGNVLD